MHQSRRQQIVFGARGVTSIDITLYGPSHELHSGHYGNWAPNPAMALARLLASMKDDDGRVLIDHFYDGIEPLSETEKRAIAEAPDVDRELMRELALGRTEGGGKKLVELINLPVAEYPRHGERAHRRRGQQRDSGHARPRASISAW